MKWQDIDVFIEEKVADNDFECAKGCAWCCHQLIVLTHWDDGRQILAAVRSTMSAKEYAAFRNAVREQAQAIAELGHERAEAKRWTCPLLRDGQCTVYEVRPIACRSVFSSKASTCRAMMEVEDFDELSEEQQAEATEIGERAFALQIAINDQRPVDGPIELRDLLVRLFDEAADR